jgi:hypothetical protein
MDMISPQLTFAQLGYPVFPCMAGTKRPATQHGFEDATTDAKQIERWQSMWPNCNWALATEGLLIVDIDAGSNWPTDNDKARDLAAAPTVTTPRGGRHHYFRQPPNTEYRNTASTLTEHVDTRATGGYVLIPPSVVDGKAYRWVDGEIECSPDELPLPPQWLIDALAESKTKERGEQHEPGAKIKDGARNDTLFRNASAMRNRGFTFDAILAALNVQNEQSCDPKLDATEVERIAKSASKYEPDNSSAGGQLDNSGRSEPVLVRLSSVQPESVRWLWPSRIALGKLTILAGEPGLGKSFLTMDIAARVSTGNPWPDAPNGFNQAGSVILLSAEDDLADTIRPRLDAAGADVEYITALQGVAYTGESRARCFNLERDLPALERAIQATPGCRLIVIDPISAYLGGNDSHKNAEIRALLMPLAELAARSKAAVLGVTHLNKGIGGKALHRITGSIAFVAAARAGWLVEADKHDDKLRLFLPIKNNLAPDAGGLAYRIIDGAVVWDSGRVDVTADEALSADTSADSRRQLADAEKWLSDYLASGPKRAKDAFEGAQANLITKATLKRAKKALKVKSDKDGFDGDWLWSIPGQGLWSAQGAQTSAPF